ncbi:uncharacterized protein LOC143010717 isoform X2 [Genypterus blacodes]|uniref:uncharacterized protein LOC143010717 isoform X2 n=1 Tax=Genypterus blacodes TaxID=154954 RepID=UPI003F77560F
MEETCLQWILHISILSCRVAQASLSVSANTSQLHEGESVSLRCEDDGWTVKRNTSIDTRAKCADWGEPSQRSSCEISGAHTGDSGVYWCETSNGETSNTINITVTAGPVVLWGPVLPVMEGAAVTLHCKTNKHSSKLAAEFYRDGAFIRSEPAGTFSIQHVSQSDEGSYKCNIGGHGESPSSWLSVTAKSTTEADTTPPPSSSCPSPHPPPSFFSPPPLVLWSALSVSAVVLLVVLVLLVRRCRRKPREVARDDGMPDDITYTDIRVTCDTQQSIRRISECGEPPVYSEVKVSQDVIYGQIAFKANRKREHPSQPEVLYSALR